MSTIATAGDDAPAAHVATGSPLRRYQDLVVGSSSWIELARYEILASFLGVVPGAPGLLLRKLFWPRLFERLGRGAVWGRSIVVRHPGKMRIGERVVVDDACHLDARGCLAGEFEIGDDTFVSRGCIISAKDGPLRLGERVNIGAGCTLYASTRLEIGADTMLAAHCYIGGGRYNPRGRIDVPLARQPLPREGVVIGEDCWIGAGVVVVDGARIGAGSVIGAGAVVTGELDPYSIAVGIPARAVGRRTTEPHGSPV